MISLKSILALLFATALLLCPFEAFVVASESAGEAEQSERREDIVPEPIFDGTVYITESGMKHDRAVILVHGMGDRGAQDWEDVIPVLAQQYHVVAFDLPGFGRSSKSNLLYDPSRYAQFVKWIADKYVKAPFVLVGHSMGGAIALRFAADYPEYLQHLVLVDAAGILNRVSLIKELYLMNKGDGGAGLLSKQRDEFDDFARLMLDRLSNDERAIKLEQELQSASVRKALLGGDPKKISSMALAFEDFGKSADRVRTPTLLVWGMNDKIAPRRTAKALLGRLPGARLTLIPGSGHVPMKDQTEIFNRILMEELTSGGTSSITTQQTPSSENGKRSVRYNHQRGISIAGSYEKIEILHCSDVKITDMAAEQVVVFGSDVIIENSSIKGSDIGLVANGSEIIATNVSIEAETAIHASRSRLDLAGVKLSGKRSAITSDNNAILLFSVSRADSPNYSGPLHGSRRVTRLKPL